MTTQIVFQHHHVPLVPDNSGFGIKVRVRVRVRVRVGVGVRVRVRVSYVRINFQSICTVHTLHIMCPVSQGALVESPNVLLVQGCILRHYRVIFRAADILDENQVCRNWQRHCCRPCILPITYYRRKKC
jgi:hypothetical protein